MLRFITVPFWSFIADKIRNKKLIFMICNIAGSLIISLYSFDSIVDKGKWVIFLISIVT